MSDPVVSIIVVNWNGESVLPDCLSSLTKLKYKRFELIVVDNGSNDKSIEILERYRSRFKNLKLVKNNLNKGFVDANNQAEKISKGEYVLLLNNDTKVSADLLNLLVARMESDSKIGVLQPKIYIMDNPKYLDNAGSFLTKIGFLRHWGFQKKDSIEFGQETKVFS